MDKVCFKILGVLCNWYKCDPPISISLAVIINRKDEELADNGIFRNYFFSREK